MSSLEAESAKDLLIRQVPFDLRSFLFKRLARWFGASSNTDALSRAVDHAMQLLADLPAQVPSCVISAVWKSWLNGWCTSRRFQEECGACILDATCGGADCLEHYAVCPAARRYLYTWVPQSNGETSIQRFLLFEPLRGDVLPFMALHIYAVYGAVNHVRAGKLPHDSFNLDILLWERWRAAMSQKPALQALLNHQWHLRRSLVQNT